MENEFDWTFWVLCAVAIGNSVSFFMAFSRAIREKHPLVYFINTVFWGVAALVVFVARSNDMFHSIINLILAFFLGAYVLGNTLFKKI